VERERGEKKWEGKGGSVRVLSTSVRGAGERRENVGAASARAVVQQRKGRGRGRLEEEEVADGWVPHGRERKGKEEAG